MNSSANQVAEQPEAGGPTEPPLEPADYTQYLIRNATEILFVLRSLRDSSDRITIHFNEGKDFLLSSVVAVDERGITLDFGGNPAANRRALEAERLFCVTRHDRIRIQFLLRGARQIDFGGSPAFHAELPDAVLRLQRREYYRLTTPVANPLRCRVPIPPPDGGDPRIVEANVLDISGGGIAVMVPPEGFALQAGMRFPNCRVDLPEIGTIVATLEIRSLFDVTLRSGAQVTRAGCQFVDLPGPMLTQVQRYIIKIDRERKAREAGIS